VTLEHVDTKEQLADIFTKVLDAKQFEKLRGKLGICLPEEALASVLWDVLSIFSYLHVFKLWGIHTMKYSWSLYFSVWHILWLKRGRKRKIYIYTLYMPVYSAFTLQICLLACYAYACTFCCCILLQLFQVCVDVGTDGATSLWWSWNLFFSIFFNCTCSLLPPYRILEHVCVQLYVAVDAATSYLFWKFSKSQYIFFVHVHCCCFIKIGTCLCVTLIGLLACMLFGEYSLMNWLSLPWRFSFYAFGAFVFFFLICMYSGG